MPNFSLVRQMRKDSKQLDAIFNDEDDGRHAYDQFVLGVSEQMWGKRLKNGKRFDASSSLSLYELSVSIDQRIIKQAVETSYLRKNFTNFPGERIFDEYTGIDPTDTVYCPIQMQETGYDSNSTNQSTQVKPSTNPNEIKAIKASILLLRRPIQMYQEGFELTLGDLELASFRNIPLQDRLTERVARNLMMQEQYFAFNYQAPGTYLAPEEQGLFNNTSIDSTITWTAGALLASATTGRAVITEFIRIRGEIIKATKNVFEAENFPFCAILSPANVNALTRPYSDLNGMSAMQGLTERGFRIAAMPILDDNQSFFYYKNYDNIEISTSRMVEAQPQSYEARKTAWFFPFRNVTAGLTVKRKESIYSVAGMNP